MKIIRIFMAALFLMLPALAESKEEPTIYVIKKGDTLWGLSERFLKDPFYWPNMWAKNSEITNPHLIVPGQRLKVFPDRIELEKKGEQAQAAGGGQKASAGGAGSAASQEVAEEKSFTVWGSEGFIMESDEKPVGKLVGIQHDRVIAGFDDIVYTDIGSSQGRTDSKFFIFLREAEIKHPVTGEVLGMKMVPLGTLELMRLEQNASDAKISKSYREIAPGALLFPYQNEKENRREITLKKQSQDISGYIVESFSGASVLGNGDVVYIDKGKSQGVEKGSFFSIVREIKLSKQLVRENIDKLPRELLGALVVIEARKNTSTALIIKSIDAIYKGDVIVTQPR